MDAVITKATVLKNVVGGGKAVVDITGELGGDILVETKAVASNKAHTIAEMLRDIINFLLEERSHRALPDPKRAASPLYNRHLHLDETAPKGVRGRSQRGQRRSYPQGDRG